MCIRDRFGNRCRHTAPPKRTACQDAFGYHGRVGCGGLGHQHKVAFYQGELEEVSTRLQHFSRVSTNALRSSPVAIKLLLAQFFKTGYPRNRKSPQSSFALLV
eukprot:5853603-Amphidinium_carterae.1